MVSEQIQKNQGFEESDKRYIPRWEVENRVLYRLENDDNIHEACTKDLSCGGACLSVSDLSSSPEAQRIKMTVYLSDKTSVNLEGRVRWVRVSHDETNMGVSFYNTSSEAQELLLEHAFELKQEQMERHWFKGWAR